jgi:multidrug efflux pump subunit AcrB
LKCLILPSLIILAGCGLAAVLLVTGPTQTSRPVEFLAPLVRIQTVSLQDVATVVDGFADTDQMLRFDGKPAALIRVSRIGNQHIIDITQVVRAYLATAATRIPEGVADCLERQFQAAEGPPRDPA